MHSLVLGSSALRQSSQEQVLQLLEALKGKIMRATLRICRQPSAKSSCWRVSGASTAQCPHRQGAAVWNPH